MKIVVNDKKRAVQPRQVYLSTFNTQEYNFLMVIEDKANGHVFERFGLLDLYTGRMVVGWTNEETIEKHLTANAFLLCPDVELTINREK